MSNSGHKRLILALTVTCVGLLALCGLLLWRHGFLAIQVAWASEQTAIFEEMRLKAHQASVEDAANYLSYVVNYYPSGSKQDKGSRLDRIVERERIRAAQDIVAYLRKQSSEDLGENPEAWIQRYSKQQQPTADSP